ncbi:MAG: NFACT family protein [Bacteroidota bacterium]
MFHNYFFLKRLANSLNQQLKGLALLECFSQNKDELILGFANEEKEFIVRANLDPNVSLLQFPEDFSRAGKNSVDLFKELIDQEVASVEEFSYERSFQVVFQNGDRLIFKMHARRANILHGRDSKVISLFKKNLSQDSQIELSSLHKKLDISRDQFRSIGSDPLELIPALGKESKIYLERKGYYELDEGEKWTALNDLLSALEENPIHLLESPLRISLLNKDPNSTNDPIAATNWLYEKTVRSFYFDKEKQQVVNQLKQKIKKSENYISKNQEKLVQIEESRSPEEIANILMANLHQIQTGLSKVVLTDIYNNEPITIKLNTSLTPQKNAEN